MRKRHAIAPLFLLAFMGPLSADTPICQPSRPLPRDELYPPDDGEMKLSIRKLEKLAAKNDAPALNALGIMYGTGTKVALDSRKSFEYYRRAAELGMPTGQINLGYMYLYGEGTEKNEAEAWRLFKLAAEVGHMRAQQFLGFMLGRGIHVEENLPEAAYCYLLAARQGSVEAQHTIATIYQQGLGVPPSHGEGLIWRERAREAARSQKPWFDETLLPGMPPEWTPPYVYVGPLAAESLVTTANYSFRVRPPNAALANSQWQRFAGKQESRNTSMWIGLQEYDTYVVMVEARGKLGAGETIVTAAQRIRPVLKFKSGARPDCAYMDADTPYKSGEIAILTGFCLRASDQEVFEVGFSRKSLALETQATLDGKDVAELDAGLNLLLQTIRFE